MQVHRDASLRAGDDTQPRADVIPLQPVLERYISDDEKLVALQWLDAEQRRTATLTEDVRDGHADGLAGLDGQSGGVEGRRADDG